MAAAFSFWYAVHHRNWLLHLVGAGTTVFVIGIVGERVPAASSGRPDSLWDLSIQVPGTPVTLDKLSVIGLVVALVGLSLVLFLERVVPPGSRWTPTPPRRLDDDDAV